MKSENKKNTGIIIAVAALLLVVLLLDIWMMFSQIREQTKNAGISQLEAISRELEKNISEAEKKTTEIAIEANEYLGDEDALEKFIKKKKKEVMENDPSVFNVYIAGSDWWIIPGFTAPKGYSPTERIWYNGAIKNDGKVYVSSPYQDAMTGNICYSVSVMLGDGDTVLAVDYTMDMIQKYIEKMYNGGGEHAVIVTDDGVIAGCSNEKLIGKQLSSAIPDYAGIWSLSKKSEDFVTSRIKSGFMQHENLFAAKSGSGWYLIVSVSNWELYKSSYVQLIVTILLAMALFLTVILAIVFSRRGRKTTEKESLAEKDHMRRFLNKKKKESGRVSKQFRNRVLIFMVLLMIFSLYINVSTTYKWGSEMMKNEADNYEYHLAEWVDTQKSILDMFVSSISTNPDMLEDYDKTISYLDRITAQYPQISVTYIGNPKFKPTVFMNNGWKPEKGWHVETRPWYTGAMASKEGWCITAPYFDSQTGGYCVTIAEQVHDAKTGKFLGVFGIDFYMDKLVSIMGDSYTDKGYAFLVDTEGNIVNHPNEKYQMSEKYQTSVLDTPYGKVKPNGKDTHVIKDYDGTIKIVLASKNKTTRFSVYVVQDAWSIYGRVIIYGIICFVTFLICIVLIYRLLSSFIAWQDEVNRRLEKAAQTDAMTGLRNKAWTENTIARAVESGKGALVILDLDSFKLVNDIYGHDMGDRVLVYVADLIRSVIRDNDIAGRIGGDEFAIYCEGLIEGDVLSNKIAYMNREIRKTAREYMGSDMDIPLGCSAGVVMVPDGGREYSVLFSKADQALHQAKKNGKHTIVIHKEEERKQSEESAGELSNLRMVFGERNQKRTAMVADKNIFRDVYRFMMRFAANCSSDLYMVVFNLHTDDDRDLSSSADQFIEIASGLLRSCDVVLKYNSKQILLLLVEANEEGYMMPVNRILDAWSKEGDSSVDISIQSERLSSKASRLES